MIRKPLSRPTEQLQLALSRIEALLNVTERLDEQTFGGVPVPRTGPLSHLRDAIDEAQAAMIDLKEAIGSL